MSKLGSKNRNSGLASAALVAAALAGAAAATVATTASADVVREGAWPAQDPKVSLSLGRVSRSEALQKLASAAGWSLVLLQTDQTNESLIVELTDVPATTALDAILMGSDWTAKREGTLVRIERRGAGATSVPAGPAIPVAPDSPAIPAIPAIPAVPATPAAPAMPTPPAAGAAPSSKPAGDRARDIVVTGESVRVASGDTVHDVTVMGGSVDVEGHLTGDLAVIGGSAHVMSGAHIDGDASAVGGSITIDEGARVDGDVSVIGGIVQGSENAKGGRVEIGKGDDANHESDGLGARAGRALSNAVSSAALLFVLGAMLIALAGDRFDQLRGEIAARPMRSLAMGIVGVLASLLTMIVLCVTIVGIPFAAVGLVLFIFAVFAGTSAAATTAGAAIGGHRVKSPYGHLAIGCTIYLVAGLLPWVGGWIQIAILLAGFGSIVATRAAGLIKKRRGALPEAAAPYR